MFSLQTSFRKEIILGPLLRPNPFFFLKENMLQYSDCNQNVQGGSNFETNVGFIQSWWEGVGTSNFTTTTGVFFHNIKNGFLVDHNYDITTSKMAF